MQMMIKLPFELANENNQIFNLNEQHDSNDNEEKKMMAMKMNMRR